MSRVLTRAQRYAAATAFVIVVAGCVAAMAARRTSVVFDEVFMIPQGARGFTTGDFSKVYEHPPGMLMIYGGAVRLAGIRLPHEYEGGVITPPEVAKRPGVVVIRSEDFFNYGQAVMFLSGNHPERIAYAARLVSVLLAMGLGIAVAAFAWRRAGPLAALFSATIVMLMPDVLAHAGIAYNDLPGALGFFLGLWAWDEAIREPTPKRAAIAAATTALALGIKFSAIALGPAALLLFAIEAASRGRDGAWYRRILTLLPLAVAVTWLVLAVIYRGDWMLAQFRAAVGRNIVHVEMGHGVPAMLLGKVSGTGFWYFFPLGILLKTPAALHALGIIALIGYAGSRHLDRQLLRSSLRLVPVGILVYLGLLMRAKLNIGVRHALPIAPLLALLIGVGVAYFWDRTTRRLRVVVAALMLAFAGSTLSYYPWFLSYLTEYVPHRREAGYRAMIDSNLDWGQGLLALRDFMREEKIDAVYLSYFGSALPEAYGIRYAPLQSFFPLLSPGPLAETPKWVVISATNLSGVYFQDQDPFAHFRSLSPDRVLGGSMYAYKVR